MAKQTMLIHDNYDHIRFIMSISSIIYYCCYYYLYIYIYTYSSSMASGVPSTPLTFRSLAQRSMFPAAPIQPFSNIQRGLGNWGVPQFIQISAICVLKHIETHGFGGSRI